MSIILDTGQKQIIVPWKYQQKLNDINKITKEFGGQDSKEATFTGYIDVIWKDCMKHSDTCVVTGQKPARNGVKKNG